MLVVDDDPGIVHLQSQALRRAGYHVTTAGTAREALDLLGRGGHDLVVLDYRLDGATTGIDVYRQAATHGDIAAILVTAFSDEDRILEALRAGIRDVVPKGGEYLEYLPIAVDRVLMQVRAERRAIELSIENRRKDEFLATLAHELRNPLAPIRFALAMLDGLPEQFERPKAVLERQITHLVRLVDDLLDVSRITRDRIQLRRELVRLEAIVHAAYESVAPMAQTRGVAVDVVDPLPDVSIDADPARMAQVVTNLLNNAVKFTTAGGRVRIEAIVDGADVEVRVSDTGRGIEPEHLDRIFDVFFQAHQDDGAGGGLGLGLTLVKRLVEMHGGTVSAHSEGTGTGAEFVLRLPIAQRPKLAVAETEPPRAARAPRRLRVLIVDDNVDGAELMACVVSMAGHEAHVAHLGATAREIFASTRPDVALLDIGLPDVSGYELAREFRGAAGDQVFLAAITGWGQEDDRRRAREAGFDCHIVKPADPELLEKLLACVGGGPPCGMCSRCRRTPTTRASDRFIRN